MSKLLRRSNNKMIAGVCAGVAEYLDLDVVLVRLGYAILTVCSTCFPGIIIYILAALIIPKE